ncbi:hypothetical protein TRFO_09781 [Tritrichomonas foetus]|uniref:Ion transport domain-containing protein n=1 Tax=Tritrichomonas foetus TaxID=1144522 RepID=A0A1J4JI33_9EUKA|nr:hypothetical protein TRFO_09781 [Tritrichomonas foetus]|eukprot:OHS96868.1 hypothetical protein TRFO_09781 [Tritrichomonas foetus]
MIRSDSSFDDISPILLNKSTRKHSLVTIDNLFELHTQLIQFSNVVIPQKEPWTKRAKDLYIIPFLHSTLSKFINAIGWITNIIIFFIETREDFYKEHFWWIFIFELFSYIIILVHVIFRITCENEIFWGYQWNYVDIICLFITPIYYGLILFHHLSKTKIIFFLKFVRLFHIPRIIRIYKPSRYLFHAIIKSIPNIGLISFLMILFIIITSAVACSLFSSSSFTWFGSITNSMYTIFIILSQSGWLKSYWKAENAFPLTTKVFYILIGFLGSYILVNTFTGISSMSIDKVKRLKEKEKEENELKKQKEMEKKKNLGKLLQRKKSLERIERFGKVTLDDLEKSHLEMKKRLIKLHQLYQTLEQISENVSELTKENEVHISSEDFSDTDSSSD